MLNQKIDDTYTKSLFSLKKAKFQTLESMAILSEFRDNETGAHIQRTKCYVKFILSKIKDLYGYSDEEIELIINSAPLHDIGKVAIPDSILLKRGRLTTKEIDIMKTHTVKGYEALERVNPESYDDYLRFAKEITLYHHEHWDGSGYPNGLKGNNIPCSARVMAIADVYDALRSKRPYKPEFSHTQAVYLIKKQAGKHFDPNLIDIFLKYHDYFNGLYLMNIDNESQ